MTTPERPDVIDVPSETATNGASAETRAPAGAPADRGPARRMDVVDLNAGFGARTIISGINLKIEPNSVTAVIGPSGCGKSTLLRCLNAMHRTATNAFVNGEILLDGVDINARGVDPVLVRRRVGMVFQRPNPFPTMSIYDNVAAGLRLTSGRRRAATATTRPSSERCARPTSGPRSRIACARWAAPSRAVSSSVSASRAHSPWSPRCC